MTGHEAMLFMESKKLSLAKKTDIKMENEKFCKCLDNKSVIEKALWDRYTKRK